MSDDDAFKAVFKFYKRRDKPVDLSDVVDFRHPEKWSGRFLREEPVSGSDDTGRNFSDLRAAAEWQIFKLLPEGTAGDGIFVIRNPFTARGA
jgi:hypothetical protein